MDNLRILWADDEIDLLKPHLLFLKEKGFDVETATNGDDALDLFDEQEFDIVFLDENMPGLSGLETLVQMKNKNARVPVVMITKSEEEHIMEEAIGSKISDYLIKPVNPNQILLTIKKNLDKKRLIAEATSHSYQREFREIGMRLGDRLNYQEWKDIYRKLVHWELELERSKEDGMSEILASQKTEANAQFFKFVENNYLDWMSGTSEDNPTMSHTVFKNKIAPKIGKGKPTFMLLIDNLRWDQWEIIRPAVLDMFKLESEDIFLSILPTATQYSRNAIFAGLTPLDIERRFKDKWLNDEDEGGKNMYEEDFLKDQMQRLNLGQKYSYNKITKHQAGKKLVESIPNMMNNDLNVIVYNFVDMLSHARTEMEMIRELADDEAAYRSITLSWFQHSPLKDMMERIAEYDVNVVITTDHGTVRVQEPSKVIGDKNTNTNLRYKQAKNLNYEAKDVFAVKNPHDAYLPKVNVSQSFIFAKEDKFFAYPNNYNYYVNFYRNTFQHGGISLEEMMIPIVHLGIK
ncbi:MAG: PglZ domain-containing protein [Flavobacteriales bacterium]|nr:PglZ domain-containing protein [Flavobacteriales bacterium]